MVAMWSMTYFIISRSEAFAIAQSFLSSSPEVKRRIGVVQSSRLGFSRFHYQQAGDEGSARFNIVMTGSLGNANADLYLTRRDGSWRVDSVTLNLNDRSVSLLVP